MHPRVCLAFLLLAVIAGVGFLSELLRIEDVVQAPYQQNGFSEARLSKVAADSLASDPGSPLSATPLEQLYTGKFELRENGSKVASGSARVVAAAVSTGMPSVFATSVAISLSPGLRSGMPEVYGANELVVKGVAMTAARKLTAFGVSDPSTTSLLGTAHCRLEAALALRGADPLRLASGAVSANAELPPVASGAGTGTELEQAGGLDGEIASIDCGFRLSLNAELVDLRKFARKVLYYGLWVNVLTVIQMRCYLTQMRYTEEGGPSPAKLSLLGLAFQALLDGYDSFLHLSLSANSQYTFNTFAMVSLSKFMLFSMLEVRYMLVAWRARNNAIFVQGWAEVRRELSRIYMYFYGALIFGLLLIFNFPNYLNVMVVVAQAYWVPQIISDVRQGSRNAMHPYFVLGISVSRSLGFLYVWGCPHGIFDGTVYPQTPGSPCATVCAAIVLIQAAQMALLCSQRLLGPRWFVPRGLLSGGYDWYRRTSSDSECVICMAELGGDVAGERRVVTPCDHRFHRACLEQWMDIKMECPTCRRELPPLD